MKIISFNVEAGGVGKTAICVNTATLLASKGFRVLVFGTDRSMNLTNRMIGYYARKNGLDADEVLANIKPENTVEMLFQRLPFSPIKITDNIDLIAETRTLYDLRDIKSFSLLHWWWDVEKYLTEEYDYILIDTHNDQSEFTKSVYAISDIITAIIDKTEKTYKRKVAEIKELLNVVKNENRSRTETFVTARVVVLANMIDKSVLGKQMRNKMNKLVREHPNDFVGCIEYRESFPKSDALYLPLWEYRKYDKGDWSLDKFYRDTERLLLKLADM